MSGSYSSVLLQIQSLTLLSCVLMVRAQSFKFYIHQWWLNKPYRVSSKSSQRGGPAVGRKRQRASNIHDTWMYNLSHCDQAVNRPRQIPRGGAFSPLTGGRRETFMLHRSPWQHSTSSSGDGLLLQNREPSSLAATQPFWRSDVPLATAREVKHRGPAQRSPLMQDVPWQTHWDIVGAPASPG